MWHDKEILGLEAKIENSAKTIEVLSNIIDGKSTARKYRKDLQDGITESETRIDLLKKNSTKIFYPDPVNDENCAQCGNSRKEHHQSNTSRFIREGEGSGPFFCNW